MILTELQRELTPFDTSTTGVVQYDNWLHNPSVAREEGFDIEVKNMTPQQYLEACCYGFKCSLQQLQQRNDQNKIDRYASQMKKGMKFPMPTLQFVRGGSFTQEGIHRALAADQVKVQQIPVLVILEQ